MKEIIKKINIYEFNELSAEAKEVAVQCYLDDQDPDSFTQLLKEQLHDFLPNSKLNVRYSLNYCQGDGVNIYGKIYLKDVMSFADKNEFDFKKYPRATEVFTGDEREILCEYFDILNISVELPISGHGNYYFCTAKEVCLKDEMENLMMECGEYGESEGLDIPLNLYKKFDDFFIKFLETMTKDFETQGYNYFYKMDFDEFQELCTDKEYYFYEDGNLYR